MMSLFSPFDLSSFSWSYLIYFLVLSLGLMKRFMLFNYFSGFFSFFYKFLMSFFSSLNNSNFSKGLDHYFFFLFLAIFFLNFSSIFPFNFPSTSQPSLILFFSFILWIMVMMFSMVKNFKGQFSHFIPEGSPLTLILFLFLIELVSNVIRPLTLMVRLVANILAGHLLIILLSTLVNYYPSCYPLLIFLNLVEIFVSLIQAYIFITLICLYYSEI